LLLLLLLFLLWLLVSRYLFISEKLMDLIFEAKRLKQLEDDCLDDY
jgi:hypothetical protein